MEEKVFVLGLDGARLEFIDRPELPHFRQIIREGAAGELFSRPALTPAAWTSMVTGKNPGKHGIFDFRVGEELLFATDKKAAELWDDVPAVVINVPMTYPAKPIEGVMVSGMMAPDLDADLVYPEEERAYLKRLTYVIEPEKSLQSIGDSIGKRIEMVKHYFESDWRLFFVVFREFDVLHHFFWGQDLPFYRMVDDFLGDYLLPRFDHLAVKLAIVSDHGFAPVDRAVNVERLLAELGHDADYEVGGWGALYQKRGAGGMSGERREEIVASLKNYRVDGEPILDVYKNEQIYWGPYAKQGPDLLVWPKRELGYTFKMRSGETIAPAAPKNGCHLEAGLVALRGFGLDGKRISADIKDIFPTLRGALGLEVADDVDGKVIN